eukprot:3600842-Pleurochrysis_carterae.AAC.1
MSLRARLAHNSFALTARSCIALVEVVHLQLLRHARGRLGGHAAEAVQHMVEPIKISQRAESGHKHKRMSMPIKESAACASCVLTSYASFTLCAPCVALCASAFSASQLAPSWLGSLLATAIFGSRIFTSAAVATTSMSSVVIAVAASLVASVGVCASAVTRSYFANLCVPSGEHTCKREEYTSCK